MESLIKKLTEIVSQEVKQYELFLQLLTEQQNHLVENDLERLNNVIRQQEDAIISSRELEKTRMRIVNELSQHLDADPNDLTLSRITRDLSRPQAEKLKGMQKRLLDLHAKINRVKSKNEFLIQKSMEYIEGTVKLFASVADDKSVYREHAPKDKRPSSIAVNRTI